MSKIPIRIEDIYPLTIVSMRYQDKIVILNLPCDSNYASDIEGNEETSYIIDEYLEDMFVDGLGPCYGIGATLVDAFINYQENSKRKK